MRARHPPKLFFPFRIGQFLFGMQVKDVEQTMGKPYKNGERIPASHATSARIGLYDGIHLKDQPWLKGNVPYTATNIHGNPATPKMAGVRRTFGEQMFPTFRHVS